MAKTKLMMTNRILVTQGSHVFNWSGNPAGTAVELREERSSMKKPTSPQFYALQWRRQYPFRGPKDLSSSLVRLRMPPISPEQSWAGLGPAFQKGEGGRNRINSPLCPSADGQDRKS